MKKVAAVLTALLLLGQPAAAECLITGEAYRIGASAAVVIDAESGEVLFGTGAELLADESIKEAYLGKSKK